MPFFTFLARSSSGCEDSPPSLRHSQRLRRRTTSAPTSKTRASKPLPTWLEWLNIARELGFDVESLNRRFDRLHGNMEDSVHLPDSHLLNPKPPRRQRRVEAVRTYSREHTSPPSQQPTNEANRRTVTPGTSSLMHSPEGSPQGAKPTKLPMPRTFADRGKISPKEKQTVVEHSKQAIARHIKPSKSSQVLGRDSPKSAEKDGEQVERKDKGRFAKDTPGPTPSKEKQKVPYEAYRKIVSLASSSRQEIAKHKLKYTGGSPKSAIPSLRGANSSPKAETRPSVDSLRNSGRTSNRRATKDRQLSINTSDSSPQKYQERNDTATDSSAQSYPSVSPVSQPESSITDWEDRFVVNMPSAKDPNPPGLTDHQIRKFQQSIESVHEAGGGMLDPDTLPSPRTTSPENNTSHRQREQKIGTLDGQESLRAPSESEEQPPGSSNRGGYYCPEEVGKQRCSTIWEDASGKLERTAPRLNPDGSFLGCKEINGPHDKNPDEILLFSTTEERPRVVDVPAPRFRKRAAAHHGTTGLEETNVQEEWRSISQNLKHAQCWKSSPKTMCRDAKCQPPTLPRLQGKGNSPPSTNPAKDNNQGPRRHTTNPDDVLIITPTITRSMVTMADVRAHAPRQPGAQGPASRTAGEIIPGARANHQMSSSPSGLRRATQNSWDISNASSAAFSKSAYPRNGRFAKNRPDQGAPGAEGPHTLSGYIRIPALVKSFRSSTENLAQSMSMAKTLQSPTSSTASSDKENAPLRSVSDTSQLSKSPTKGVLSSMDTGVSQRNFRDVLPSSRIMEVAELDGHQVERTKDAIPFQPKPTTDSPSKISKTTTTNNHKATANSSTMSLLVDILALSTAQVQTLYNQVMANRHSKTTLAKIGANSMLYMVAHCLRVIRDLLTAVSIWNTTGRWPRPNKKDLAGSVTEIVQAVAYALVLAFIMVIVGRTAGVAFFFLTLLLLLRWSLQKCASGIMYLLTFYS
ncbi:hypothetical protein P168DRAFT_306615 [Aspergillus campestris IBT 28561]|uniref:NTP binding protein n=1 Tax=Aspergillus campestris (strain IBT 28561) TaxID=1392248 RepID=A0A2I1CUY4_ASPC2|nr:uncharacterized protein P168DRAFT_306615 [Aspergillus campestris IBT 28561]PKY01452.1 hypothetical protein P168DRAFT_306615 [Aspergillus campestris IBT 28561]